MIGNFPIVSHLSKFVIVSSHGNGTKNIFNIFKKILNYVHIYEVKQKLQQTVVARVFYRTQTLKRTITFKSTRKDLSEILFPVRSKNLNGFPLYIAYAQLSDTVYHPGLGE